MNSIPEINSFTSYDNPKTKKVSQRRIRLEDKFLLKSKKKSRIPNNKTVKVNNRKFRSKLEGAFRENKRKFRSPHIFTNVCTSMPSSFPTPCLKNNMMRLVFSYLYYKVFKNSVK